MFYFLNHKTTILNIDILHFPTVVGTEGLFIACESLVVYNMLSGNGKKDNILKPKISMIDVMGHITSMGLI